MHLTIVNHPLVDHKLTVLRDKKTPSNTFRELVSELVMLEAYEATRNISVEDAPIETPVAPYGWQEAHEASPYGCANFARRLGYARRHDPPDSYR